VKSIVVFTPTTTSIYSHPLRGFTRELPESSTSHATREVRTIKPSNDQTRSMGTSSAYPDGALLKYNTLWRSGMHHAYVFFKVTHTTTKGTVMGMRVTATWTCEHSDDNSSCERWDIGVPHGAVRRLPHPRRWTRVSQQEVEDGVRAVSCVH